MLLTTFEVIVGVSADEAPSETLAIAEATRYLCAASEEFAADADVWRVGTYDGPSAGADGEVLDWGVSFNIDFPVSEESQADDLLEELEAATYVETVERIA